MIIERLKFYADTLTQKNKPFCWTCSILDLEDKLIEFMLKGFTIRSAWYERKDNETGQVLENTRINDLQRINNKAQDIMIKALKTKHR